MYINFMFHYKRLISARLATRILSYTFTRYKYNLQSVSVLYKNIIILRKYSLHFSLSSGAYKVNK